MGPEQATLGHMQTPLLDGMTWFFQYDGDVAPLVHHPLALRKRLDLLGRCNAIQPCPHFGLGID